MNKLDNNSKTILTICIIAALIVMAALVYTAPAKAGTAQPLPSSTPTYPIICTDTETGNVTLVADGHKVRIAYWNNQPYFTDSNRAARHKRTFTAPTGSVCRMSQKS